MVYYQAHPKSSFSLFAVLALNSFLHERRRRRVRPSSLVPCPSIGCNLPLSPIHADKRLFGARSPRNARRANDIRPNSQSRQAPAPRDVATSANQSRRGGKSGASAMSRSTNNSRNGSLSQATPSTYEEPPPVASSNVGSVDAALKQGFDSNAPVYKPEAKPQPARSESPWGTKGAPLRFARTA